MLDFKKEQRHLKALILGSSIVVDYSVGTSNDLGVPYDHYI